MTAPKVTVNAATVASVVESLTLKSSNQLAEPERAQNTIESPEETDSFGVINQSSFPTEL